MFNKPTIYFMLDRGAWFDRILVWERSTGGTQLTAKIAMLASVPRRPIRPVATTKYNVYGIIARGGAWAGALRGNIAHPPASHNRIMIVFVTPGGGL